MKMPHLYPSAKPLRNLLLRSLFVFIAFLFSISTFGEFTPAPKVTTGGFTYIPAQPKISSFTPTSAINGNGTEVTIKGYHFANATAVSLGGIPASSFSVVSDSTITAMVFISATGYVKVTTPEGADSLGGFTSIPGAPRINSFTPISGSSGTVVTITGIRLVNVTAVRFGSTPASSFSVVSDSLMTAVVSTGSSGYLYFTRDKKVIIKIEERVSIL